MRIAGSMWFLKLAVGASGQNRKEPEELVWEQIEAVFVVQIPTKVPTKYIATPRRIGAAVFLF